MNYVKIFRKQDIILEAKKEATVSQALNDAIEFAKEHQTIICTLRYNGFEFDIEKDSNINEKVTDYVNWLNK